MTRGKITTNGKTYKRPDLAELSLDELADMAAFLPESFAERALTDAEFRRREVQAIVDGAAAQRNSARYLLYSVVAILLASFITAGAAIFGASNQCWDFAPAKVGQQTSPPARGALITPPKSPQNDLG